MKGFSMKKHSIFNLSENKFILLLATFVWIPLIIVYLLILSFACAEVIGGEKEITVEYRDLLDFKKEPFHVAPGANVNIDITKYGNSYFLNLKECGGVVKATGIYGIDWTTVIRLVPSLITDNLDQPATIHDGTVVHGSKITSTVDVYKGGRIEYAIVEKGASLHLYEGAAVEGLQVYGTLIIDDGVVFLKDNNTCSIYVYDGASVICTGEQIYEYHKR